jgi:pre-mRNA-splicing factor 38A
MTFLGGTYGGLGRPTPFLCLAFKLLQLVPDKEVILEYLNFHDSSEGENGVKEEADEETNEAQAARKTGDFKYLRALAAFYIRLAWEPVEIYKTLEPLLLDFRKIKRRTREGFALTYMDQFIDDLLTKDRVCATALWKLPSRAMFEDLDMLEPRESPMQAELDEMDDEADGSDRERSEKRRDDDQGSNDGKSDGERSEDEKDITSRNGNRSRSSSNQSERRLDED